MKKYAFLSYIINHFDPSDECYCVISQEGDDPREVKLDELSKCKQPIVTYTLPSLALCFQENNLPLPERMFDVEQAGKMIIGHSHSEYDGPLPWTVWGLLDEHAPSTDKGLLSKVRNWNYRSEILPDEQQIISSLITINTLLGSLWSQQLIKLESLGELQRFISIEVPINSILLKSQYDGIKIDSEKLNNRLDAIDEIICENSEKLRSRWGVLDVYDIEALRQSLAYSGYDLLAKMISPTNLRLTVDSSPDSIEPLHLYNELKKARRDKKSLLKFGAIGGGKIHPIFDGMGTVTGRILVKSPAIQQLKKSSRDVIVADKSYTLLYPDFNQFEPGIMADDSGDEALIKLYNSGDVYDALSNAVFGNKGDRKTAKQVFLSFSYGMTQERIVELISAFTNDDPDSVGILVSKFFDQFSVIQKWKEGLFAELLEKGRVGTRYGNYRYRKNDKKKTLSDVEKRWVISQRIQGTASLIVKRCILKIAHELPDTKFLIPMHDAVLYQVPSTDCEKRKGQIKAIFLEEFKRECPSIVPRVSFENFDQS